MTANACVRPVVTCLNAKVVDGSYLQYHSDLKATVDSYTVVSFLQTI